MLWNVTGKLADKINHRGGRIVASADVIFLENIARPARPSTYDGFTTLPTAHILTDRFGPTNAKRIIGVLAQEARGLFHTPNTGGRGGESPSVRVRDLIDYVGFLATTQQSKRSAVILPEDFVDAITLARNTGSKLGPFRRALRRIEKAVTPAAV